VESPIKVRSGLISAEGHQRFHSGARTRDSSDACMLECRKKRLYDDRASYGLGTETKSLPPDLPTTTTSTRRLRARPASVLLLAMG
jgi:hypothetical protein